MITKYIPRIRYGPKGISVFVLNFLYVEKSHITDTAAAIQKARMSALIPKLIPVNQPIPKTNFASPRPIHAPFDTNHNSANGRASSGPATKAEILGTCSSDVPPTHRLISDTNMNV